MNLLFQKRRLKANKIKRKIAANRAFLQRFRVFLSTIMILGICYCSLKVLKLPQWYINEEKLNAASPDVLKIEGNIITPDYKIINMVRQTQIPYTQVFRLDTKELEENISKLQPVKKVYVRRYWFPARLIISIDERMPAFLLAPNLESEPLNAISTDGILIDHDYLPFIEKNTKTRKLLTYGVRNGVDEVWDKKRVEEILKLTKAIETYSRQEVQYIDLRNQKDVYIMLKEHLIRFGEIDDSSLSRAKWIASILPEAEKVGDKVKYIDLRWEDSHYLRLKGTKEEIKAPSPNSKDNQKSDNGQSNIDSSSNNENVSAENSSNSSEDEENMD